MSTYIPISQQIDTTSVRQDVLNIISPILDNIAYIDSTILGDTDEGVFYYYFEVLDGVYVPLPLIKDLGIEIGTGVGEVGITFFDNGNFEAIIWLDVLKLRIPRSILIPPKQDAQGNIVPDDNTDNFILIDLPLGLTMDGNLKIGMIYPGSSLGAISLPEAFIGNTGIRVAASNVNIDMSSSENIAEADIDGRSSNFIGFFLQSAAVSLPSFLVSASGSTTSLIASNLLVGTGGVSGSIGLLNSGGIINYQIGENFKLSINHFDIQFKLNSIIGSNIVGTLTLPSQFEQSSSSATIAIQAAFANNGDFSLTASSTTGIDIEIPDVLTIKIYELSLGDIDGKFFIKINGALKITAAPAGFNLMDDFVPVPGIIIWEDGSLEIEGGRIPIPNAFELKLGPTTISITAIDYGTADRNGRKYSYFGFSGGLDMSPGGVDIQGNGIKYFYTTDDDPLDHFLELDQIGIDIHLPAHMDSSKAKVNINGFLSISNPQDNSGSANDESGNPSKEYMGSVAFLLRLKEGAEISGGAAMRLRPKEPSFVVDAFMEINKPIPLGTTGLGIFGFRGLIGQRFVPSKSAANISENSTWWNYYKAPVEGVNVGKFGQKDGFSIGAGLALATSEDDGYAFSSKLMLVLGLPDVLLLTGQAGVLQERIRYTSTDDPPFFAALAVSREGVEVGLGARYLLPKDSGAILDIYAEAEIAYFFNNPKGWYIYVGREYPTEKRTQARIFQLFNSSSYLMITPSGIRAGATSGFNIQRKYGPVRLQASAYIDIKGEISFKPLQIGGSIALRAVFRLKVSKFGLSLEAGAGLAAEAPQPFIIQGYIYVSIKLPWPFKRQKFNVEFSWRRNTSINREGLPPIGLPAASNEGVPANAVNMLTGETFPIIYTTNNEDITHNDNEFNGSGWNAAFSEAIVPLDSFIDIQFERGISPNLTITNIGGHSFSPSHSITIPPRKGASAQVNHSFKVEKVEIKIWDPSPTTGGWKDYKVYEACTPIRNVIETQNPGMDPHDINEKLSDMRDGYWQLTDGNKINKLRVACDNVFSYTQQASEGNYEIENFEIGGETIFCGVPLRVEVCKDWENESVSTNYAGGVFHTFNEMKLKFIGQGGTVENFNAHGFTRGIVFDGPSSLDIYFNKPMVEVKLKLESTADNIIIEFFDDQNNLVSTENETPASLSTPVQYSDNSTPITRARVSYDGGGAGAGGVNTAELRFGRRTDATNGGSWYSGEMSDVILCDAILSSGNISSYLSTPNSGVSNMVGRWEMKTSVASDSVGGINGQINNIGFSNDNDRGNHYDFNGGNSYVEVNQNNNHALLGNDFTVMCWFKTTQTNLGILIDNRDSFGYHMFVQDGRVGYQIMNNYKYVNKLSSSNGFADDNWHHAALTHNSTTGETILYVDGSVERTTIETTLLVPNQGHLHLMECCYLSEEDFNFNATIPTQTKVNEDIEAMTDAMTLAYQPIWRPYSKFAIHVHATDTVDGVVKDFHFNFGFQTKGAIGHFPLEHENFKRLPEAGKEKQITIASLKQYIDYKHSYPNAEGKLTGEKPVYRDGVRLKLFFTKPYINSMFADWDGYKGNSTVNQNLKVLVFDPEVENGSGISLNPELVINEFDYETTDKQIIKNIFNNGVVCIEEAPALTSQNISGEYVLPVLSPGKLYTAVFYSETNEGISGSTMKSKEVHRYGFLTSKYLDFGKHIDSYIFDDSAGIDGKAIYNINTDITDLSDAIDIINDTLINTSPLVANYADKYDRLMTGALQLKELNAAVDLEISLLKDDNSRLIGVLVRSPEPIWNPKMPLNQSTPPLSISNSNDATAYKKVYSKDRSAVFISNTAMDIPDGILTIDFQNYSFGLKELAGGGVEFAYTASTEVEDQKSIQIDLTDYN